MFAVKFVLIKQTRADLKIINQLQTEQECSLLPDDSFITGFMAAAPGREGW